MEGLMAVLIMGIFTYGTYAIFELFVRRKERMALIDKMSSGISSDFSKIQLDLFKKEERRGWTIRIGCLLLGIGLGVGIVAFIDMNTIPQLSVQEYLSLEGNDKWNIESSPVYRTINILYPASAIFFGGLGLIISYFIENKLNRD